MKLSQKCLMVMASVIMIGLFVGYIDKDEVPQKKNESMVTEKAYSNIKKPVTEVTKAASKEEDKEEIKSTASTVEAATATVGSVLEETLTHEQAEEDLQYLMGKLQTYHPAWLEVNTELVNRVESQYKKEVDGLGESVSVLELWQSASRVIHEMQDAHTRVSTVLDDDAPYYSFKEGVQTINGEPIETIYQRFLALWPYELETYAKTRFDKYIGYEDYLKLVGVDTTKGIEVTYGAGTASKHLVPSIKEKQDTSFVSYEIDAKKSVGLFTLTECKENAEYLEALRGFFNEVSSQQIQSVVVDLRANNGGWIPIIQDFMKYIDVDQYQYCNQLWTRVGSTWKKEQEEIMNKKEANAFKGKLYLLTGSKTFSAAMDFAMVIQDNHLGEIVGEGPGNMPDSYTMNQKFQLPYSKLKLVVSCGKQSRIDETKKGKPLQPDYEVPSDQALEKVYELME